MSELTHGALFSGSGGFELAASYFAIRSLWASEIEPFPIAVTKKNFPEMKHLGDISRIRGDQLPPVDIISGGSPCQDMSIAGKREGLDGERSVLFREYVRIVKEARKKHGKPRFMVWENVPGAFTSNNGEDFRCVLEEISKISEEDASIPRPPKGKWGGKEQLWETVSALPGVLLTLNTGEFPNVESASSLLRILEDTPQERYYLSAKACLGILARASRRNKELPEVLKKALIRQSEQ